MFALALKNEHKQAVAFTVHRIWAIDHPLGRRTNENELPIANCNRRNRDGSQCTSLWPAGNVFHNSANGASAIDGRRNSMRAGTRSGEERGE